MPHFFAPDGARLFYTDTGSGLPVLCLAGLTRDHRDFGYVAPHLGDTRLICLDYRGRGKSDWSDPATYTIPQEATDAIALLDHLGLRQTAVLGTSRGGLIAMALAATVKDRLRGVALNDIGPDIAPAGLEVIKGYLGKRPVWKTHDEAAQARPQVMKGFANVPADRWRAEVEKFYPQRPDGLGISYDPKLRDAVLDSGAQPVPDLWPLFDALKGLPLCALRGANSDLLSPDCFAEMQRRRPDMIAAEIPDRGHVPFLDEPASLDALTRWLGMLK